MDIYWKITLTTLLIGVMTALVGMMVDASLGFCTKWEKAAFAGMVTALVSGVMSGLGCISLIW